MIKQETVNENLCFGKKEKGLLDFREGGRKEGREEGGGEKAGPGNIILQTRYLSGPPTGSMARV